MNYIGLPRSFPKISPKKTVPGDKCIEICDEVYSAVRAELIELGRHASKWIRAYFLELDDVNVSSRDHFLDLISAWKHDVCHDP